MAKTSAGILLFRRTNDSVEVLLAHPGGPFWAKKDVGVWSIPKGEIMEGEDSLAAARREFCEETGMSVEGDFTPLEPCRQSGGKLVLAWAVEAGFDTTALKSNVFSMEWPPRSGRQMKFPEVDRAEWFSIDDARQKILKGQTGFLNQLPGVILR